MKTAGRYGLLALCLALTVTKAAAGQATFFDDFNRADGPVGNGWVDATDNPGPPLAIRSNVLTTSNVNCNIAGVARPTGSASNVTVSAEITEKNGYGGLLKGYDSLILFKNNGSIYSGIGIYVTRSDQNYENSTITLVENGQNISHVFSTLQFGSRIFVESTLAVDGTVSGVVGDGNSIFEFAFPSRDTSNLTGKYTMIVQGCPDTRASPLTYATIDNVRVEYGAVLSHFPIRGFTEKDAEVVSVFDHSMRRTLSGREFGAYSPCDGVVTAFTGVSVRAGLQANCSDGYAAKTNVVIDGINYAGDSKRKRRSLNYDGHPGYDYRVPMPRTPIVAATSGKILYPAKTAGAAGLGGRPSARDLHTLAQVPDDDATKRIYYMHLSTYPGVYEVSFPEPSVDGCYKDEHGNAVRPPILPLPPGTWVAAGCPIGLSGWAGLKGPSAEHLHFEVQRMLRADEIEPTRRPRLPRCWSEIGHPAPISDLYCIPIDPYGWKGTAGTDCSARNPADWTGDINYCLTGIESRPLWSE